MGSTYFRFLKAGACCPCTPKVGQCVDGETVIGDNPPDTKRVRFQGVTISNGTACGTTTAHCDNLFNVPVVLDRMTENFPGYDQYCSYAYQHPADNNCDGELTFPDSIARITLVLGPLGPGGTYVWLLRYHQGPEPGTTPLEWPSADLGAGLPIDMAAWTGPLIGTQDNRVFGLSPERQCTFADVTAEIIG